MPAPKPYTDEQAIADGLLRPGEIGDISLAEQDAGKVAVTAPKASPAPAPGDTLSAEDFFSAGTQKPKAQVVGETSAEDFFGVAPESQPLTDNLNPRLVKPGDPGYLSRGKVPRLIYKKGATAEQMVSVGVEGVKAVADTAATMLSGLAAMVPAGYTALAEKVYQAAGGDLSNEQVAEHIQKVQEKFTYTPRSEVGQVTGEILAEGMDKGMSWAEGKASQNAYNLAKANGKSEKEAQDAAQKAGFDTRTGLEYLMNVLPFGAIKPGFKVNGKVKAPPPELDPYTQMPPAKQGPEPNSPPLYVDIQGNVLTAEALTARDQLAARMPEAFKPIPEMETSSVRGAALASELDKQFDVKTPEERKILHSKRGREIRDAFNTDKDYADYLRWYADNQAAMREIVPPEIVGPPVELPHEAALTKIAEGRRADLTPEESSALQKLTTEDWNAMREKRGASVYTKSEESKAIDELALKKLGLTVGVVAAAAPFASEEQLKQMSLLGAVLAIKPKGGMWHPEAARKLSEPIFARLQQVVPNTAEGRAQVAVTQDQTVRMAQNYLNKHAATATDPLRDVQIPFGDHTEGFGKVIEALTSGDTAKTILSRTDQPRSLYEAASKAKVDELIYSLQSSGAIVSYLRHVGDYLHQNVPASELPKYDLVRAVKETAKWDAEMAKKMKDAAKSGEGTVLYKQYPDGMKWVEVQSPEALKAEGDVMGHCVGGYCEAVAAGDSKIYSLRDKNGESHVTVEVGPKETGHTVEVRGQRFRDIRPGTADDILQIKGKQNRAPVDKYLPYVQDFVKSDKWGEVNDLANAKLYDMSTASKQLLPAEVSAISERTGGNRFATQEQFFGSQRIIVDKEQGFADPKLLGRLAAIGIGGAVGATLDPENPFEGAVLGSLGVGVATLAHPRQVAAKIKGLFESDKRLRITDLADKHEYAIKAAARSIWQVQNKLIESVPDPLRRSAISHWIEGDKSIKLTSEELKAAKIATDFFSGMKETGLNTGVLNDALENYVTHLWKLDDKLRGMLEAKAQASTMSPNTRFAKTRFVPTLQEGMKPIEDGGWGLTPITEDISEIIGIYGSSITKAMANRDIINTLKTEKTPEGKGLLEKMDVAPPSYNFINHPQLQGYRVHPDIAPTVRFLFDNKDPNVLVRSIEGLNTLSKRMLVSFSMFHAKALIDAYLGASVSGPIGAAKHIPKFLSGDHVLLKQLRTGGAGDLLDKAIKGGLMFSLERALPAVEDVGGSFYSMMKDAQIVADKVLPGTGLAVKGFTKVNHLVDKFMWERLHAGMKLQIFSEKYSRLLETNAKAHSRDGSIPLKSEAELAKIAASFTNDMFGGLNWRMLAEEATTKLGRDMAQAAYSPSGRRALQFLLFAPDWTISTTRAALKAFGPWTGFRGLIEPTTLADLHRQYVLRSALYYALIGTVLNQAFSGKPLWENADPTYIDMGDGRRMQWSKHTMEPVHWLMHPRQQALNKLSQVIKVPIEQIMGVQYLSASGHAPRIEEGRRLVSAAKALSPIAVQQGFESGEGSGIAGFLGAPIYGKTDEQKAEDKRSRKTDYQGRIEALRWKRERLLTQ